MNTVTPFAMYCDVSNLCVEVKVYSFEQAQVTWVTKAQCVNDNRQVCGRKLLGVSHM